jgi:integrase
VPKRQWPAVKFKEKRAITLEEHQEIIAAEVNPERKALYQLCWHLGGSQGDIVNLKREDVDWKSETVSFRRKKTGVPVVVHLGSECSKTYRAKGCCFRTCRVCWQVTGRRSLDHAAASLGFRA